jgi:putative membrane protein
MAGEFGTQQSIPAISLRGYNKMDQILSESDRTQLDRQIADAEMRTKAQIVLATAKRCDSYAELPWKAFALGASVAGLLVVAHDLLLPSWNSNTAILVSIAATLAAGTLLALLAILVPGFARALLSGHRAEVEVQQYAESLFLSREIFATRARTGILLLISLFERRVVILPDKGLRDRLPADALQNIIAQVSRALAKQEVRRALEAGLEELVRVLVPSAPEGLPQDELSNEIVEGKGI